MKLCLMWFRSNRALILNIYLQNIESFHLNLILILLLMQLSSTNSHNSHSHSQQQTTNNSSQSGITSTTYRNNEVRSVMLYGIPIIALVMDSQERLCLAQISNTLLKSFSYNEIHNR